MDGPADGTIFKSKHHWELVDVCSKLIVNLAKAAKTYHPAHARFLNPPNVELNAFVAKQENDFDNHH